MKIVEWILIFVILLEYYQLRSLCREAKRQMLQWETRHGRQNMDSHFSFSKRDYGKNENENEKTEADAPATKTHRTARA